MDEAKPKLWFGYDILLLLLPIKKNDEEEIFITILTKKGVNVAR